MNSARSVSGTAARSASASAGGMRKVTSSNFSPSGFGGRPGRRFGALFMFWRYHQTLITRNHEIVITTRLTRYCDIAKCLLYSNHAGHDPDSNGRRRI
jgi:hypothetical protein